MKGKEDLSKGYWNPKKEIGGQAFFRDHNLIFKLAKNAIRCYVFWSFLGLFLVNCFRKCVVTPSFRFGFQKPLLGSVFPTKAQMVQKYRCIRRHHAYCAFQ